MSNVHEFDIKVWDEDAPEVDGGRWVDIGHAGSSGRYRSAGRRTSRFGDFRDNRYDTWHPSIGSVASPFPPFFSATNGLDGVPGSAADGLMFNGDDDGNGISDDETELGWAGSDDEVQALTAMKITIRYYDVSSNQMRQLTLVQSLLK